jgi:hypothetical protein
MHTTLHYSFSTKTCGLANFLKEILASSNVALATSIDFSLESQVAHELIHDQ